MKIKIKDLVVVMDVLKTSLKSWSDTVIELEKEDYYWEIADEELYDPSKKPNPANFLLGQLSDDWEDLKRLKVINDDVIPVKYDLQRLAAILKVINDRSGICLF